MEQLHMYHIHEILHRRRLGYSARRIAEDLGHSRSTVVRYLTWGEARGYLDITHPLPSPEDLIIQDGERLTPPRLQSGVAPYRETGREVTGSGRGDAGDSTAPARSPWVYWELFLCTPVRTTDPSRRIRRPVCVSRRSRGNRPRWILGAQGGCWIPSVVLTGLRMRS